MQMAANYFLAHRRVFLFTNGPEGRKSFVRRECIRRPFRLDVLFVSAGDSETLAERLQFQYCEETLNKRLTAHFD